MSKLLAVSKPPVSATLPRNDHPRGLLSRFSAFKFEPGFLPSIAFANLSRVSVLEAGNVALSGIAPSREAVSTPAVDHDENFLGGTSLPVDAQFQDEFPFAVVCARPPHPSKGDAGEGLRRWLVV